MTHGFEKWWLETGRTLDPDTEDVPLQDKLKGLMELAFLAGHTVGMAEGGNYTADHSVYPTEIQFSNGRIVGIGKHDDDEAFLTIRRAASVAKAREK
jgi:hypothetical protein